VPGDVLFVCLVFELPQPKWYTAGHVIRCKHRALLDTCQGCRSRSRSAYGSHYCCLLHRLEISQLVFICLTFKVYLQLFLWHPTIILDPPPSSKRARAPKADRCPLCLSGPVKGALCIPCLSFYILLVSRGTFKLPYCHSAPKVPIHLSLIQILCSFVDIDICGSQLFCMTSNQLQYGKGGYRKLPTLYQTIRAQFSLV